MKIAFIYNGNKEYINQLLNYDVTFLIDNEDYVNDLLEYKKDIKMLKYNNNSYDLVIAETDEFGDIRARKKVAIGQFEEHKKRITYLDEFNIDEALKEPDKKNIFFSIIVPNYNNAGWINRTIESVLNQRYENWEMYIIDDMSTDNSIDIINKYKDDRITLIQNEIKLYNGGSRNVGILKAKKSNPFGYLLFIDSDDWLANEDVLMDLNIFIDDEDLITLDFQMYKNDRIVSITKQSWQTKAEMFKTIGSFCAVWCKCFKTSIAPLFEFNTLMEDRNYHYRLVNKVETIANFGQVTHTYNRMNMGSITMDKAQKYDSELQCKIEWNNCAYRHIAGMLDLLNELDDPEYISFIKGKIEYCKSKASYGDFGQY